MSWFFKLAICLSFLFSTYHSSEARHQKKLPSAVVVGTVYCHTCSHQDSPKPNHFITGASVEIQCEGTGGRGGFRHEVKTNNRGEFRLHLPTSVSKHADKIRGCSVRLIRSNEPSCAVAASATSSSLRLKSTRQGKHIFSAGLFSFRPQICGNKKSNINKRLSPESNSKKQTDQLPFVPIPFLPPPLLPPNPLQPPPSLIPPVFPTPPPSILPPVLPTPPTPPFFPLPPIPGLVPSPPPPPPTFPIPLPPFPFEPTPGFPGVPPAEVSRTSSP